MIRRLAHLRHEHEQGAGERRTDRDFPPGRPDGDGAPRQDDEQHRPRELQGARHAEDIAEQEEMADGEPDDQADPPLQLSAERRTGGARDQNHGVQRGDAKAGFEWPHRRRTLHLTLAPCSSSSPRSTDRWQRDSSAQ